MKPDETVIPNSIHGNRFMFTGREYIQEIGTYDYRNRLYSPFAGRFLQTDPIGFEARDYNLMRFVSNGALNKKDPFGLDQVIASYDINFRTAEREILSVVVHRYTSSENCCMEERTFFKNLLSGGIFDEVELYLSGGKHISSDKLAGLLLKLAGKAPNPYLKGSAEVIGWYRAIVGVLPKELQLPPVHVRTTARNIFKPGMNAKLRSETLGSYDSMIAPHPCDSEGLETKILLDIVRVTE
jgi:RHS repeat-associated protein